MYCTLLNAKRCLPTYFIRPYFTIRLSYFSILLLCIYTPVAYSQCGPSQAIRLTGDVCIGGLLKATTNTAASSIIWKLNGSKTVATQTPNALNAATTVAGGNREGTNASQLSYPDRIFVDAAGNLFIPDMGNNRIQKWAPGATAGVTVAGGNGAGPASNQFNRPTSVYVDAQGNLYVTDQNNWRVQKWVPGATTGITVASSLSSPTAVFVDAAGNIYVSEQNSSLVSKWTPGATTGIVVAGGNGYGSAAYQLSTPTGIFVDSNGNIYICDTDNNRIQKWAPGATAGSTVAGGNGFGSAANQLANPLGVYVDAAGNIYVSDFNNLRVQKWAPGAAEGTTILGNRPESGINQAIQPVGISMDAECNLYVSDFFYHRVQKIATMVTNTYTTLEPGDYTATVITSTGSAITSNVVTVLPSKTPQITISSKTITVCPDAAATFKAITADAGLSPSYQWEKNGIDVGQGSDTYTDNGIQEADVITCVVTSNAVCLDRSTATSNPLTMHVQKTAVPVSLGPDVHTCAGIKITLDAGASHVSYLWQDGSTSSRLSTAKPGTYAVRAQDACGRISTDTVLVFENPVPQSFLPKDTAICSDGFMELQSVTAFKTYLWNTAAVSSSIEVRSPGWYWLQVTDQNNCVGKDSVLVRKKECFKRFYVPSAFTPNGDGKNDILKPFFLDQVKNFSFVIYNRWGNRVFSTTEGGKGWDGKLNGALQNTNVFIWICTYQFAGEPVRFEKGTVTLIR